MKKEFLPKSIRIIKNPMNSKVVWNFFRGSGIKEKSLLKIRKSKYCSDFFEYKNSTLFQNHYDDLNVGSLTGVAICAKSHLYRLSKDWLKSMRNIRLRVFVGILLNKNTNGLVHNILLRCKISKTMFLMRFNLNSPNILTFFSEKFNKKNAKHASIEFKFKENLKRRSLGNKYGSYNKK